MVFRAVNSNRSNPSLIQIELNSIDFNGLSKTATNDSISQTLGRSIADLAWAHSFLGLNCVADRLFATSQLYEPDHEFTALGAALVQYNFSKHIDR